MIKISTRAANRLRFRWFLVTDRYLHIKSTALSKLAFAQTSPLCRSVIDLTIAIPARYALIHSSRLYPVEFIEYIWQIDWGNSNSGIVNLE